jgi:hypothetical protein
MKEMHFIKIMMTHKLEMILNHMILLTFKKDSKISVAIKTKI